MAIALFPASARGQSLNLQFGGTVLDRCTITSNPGGQLGFLTSVGVPYGVSSQTTGGSAATLRISCNGGNRNLQITAVEMTSPTPASFSPTSRSASAVRTTGGGRSTTSTFSQTGNTTGSATGRIRLARNRTHDIVVNMNAEQATNQPLQAGTYRLNVRLTVVP